MEFFDINYCRALIESNKSEDVLYKIEEIKNINNTYIHNLIKIGIKLKYETLENNIKLRQYKSIIIKNIINIHLLTKEIKNENQNDNLYLFLRLSSRDTIL